MSRLQIRLDDLRSKKITDFLLEHLENMHEITPPQSVHALDLEALRLPDITFFSAWEGDELLGCGALKELDSRSGEIKSMRTAKAHRRKGVASKILEHIIKEAERRAYHHLNLETGAIRVRPSTSLVHTIWVRVPKPLCRLH
ncbi:GNAT family N-acetyltransferase [Nostoc flagelliforme]|uniref:GNAT family N-acetyltransferase n=1 Tax=Nostoc flagelliforme TaxID=1306274 RepID=UPI001CEDCB0F|nr:GNAT family N-acetyltransferase [Nostoc flagelliforme]